MQFPNTLDEFIEQYSFIDKEEIYTNGSELIPTFRIKQWEEHKQQERNKYKELYEKEIEKSKKFKEYLNGCIKELNNQSMNSLKNVINGGIIEITKTILEKYEDLERL